MTNDLSVWMNNHYPDYVSAMRRVEKVRTLLLSGSPESAGEILRQSYVFAVLSIQTGLERHEKAFSRWASGSDIRDAAGGTVYPNQKANWMEKTLREVDWEALGMAVQNHYRSNRLEDALDAIETNLTGVSYRKGGFTLAMAGGYEFMCIDSHVADFAGLEDTNESTLTYYSPGAYLDECEEIVQSVPNPLNLPPFLLQWALFDFMRGEHSRHMTFYREVLPEIIFEG